MRKTLTVIPATAANSFYPTPADVADMLCDMVAHATRRNPINHPKARILEPSCGTGALGRVIREYWPEAFVTGIELDPDRANVARDDVTIVGDRSYRTFDRVITGSWLDFPLTTDKVETIIMNPPFTTPGDPSAWVTHIRHSWAHLSMGGVLAAVVPSSDAKIKVVSKLEGSEWDSAIQLPDGSFSVSGTDVRCALICGTKRVAS